MAKYLVAAFLALLGGGVAEFLDATTPRAHAIGNCNTDCRMRKWFKHCAGGTTSGTCRYYEEGTCEHCQNTGWCDADGGGWSMWPCKRKLNTFYYNEPETNCIHHCGCGNSGILITEGSVFTINSDPILGERYNCQWFDELPP